MCTWHGALPPPFEASHLPPPLWGRVARRRQGYGGLAHSPAEAQRRRVGEGDACSDSKSPTRLSRASARHIADAPHRLSSLLRTAAEGRLCSPQGGGERKTRRARANRP